MSGGVDSSVAAALLCGKGYEVIGLTMCFNLSEEGKRRRIPCCGIEGIEDARRVAHKLKIRHYVVNMQKYLKRYVIDDFIQEYSAGRTPNPCVRCNQFLKFDILLKKALSLDAEYLATGHYARIEKVTSRQPSAVSFKLRKGKDKNKDQSYFLYRLNQAQLKHILFPLGGYTKQEVRSLARDFGLAVADKAGSQEICFLPDDDYRVFIKGKIKGDATGDIIDGKGNILGRHRGIAYYTIGQRQGLGIALGYPAYIIGIEAKTNRIIIGPKAQALSKSFMVKECHFIADFPEKKIAAKVKIRYNHKEAPADIYPMGEKIRVAFKKAQFAVTCGQSAVFYDKDTVLGGGIIDCIQERKEK